MSFPIRFLLAIGVSALVSGALLRLLLFVQFGLAAQVTLQQLPGILGLGALADLAQLPWLLLPVAMLLVPGRQAGGRTWRRVRFGALAAILFGQLFIAALQYFFFEEFDSRFNLVAVDYLIYPTEVVGNIRDTYAVGPLAAGLAGVALLAALAWWPWIGAAAPHGRLGGWGRVLALGGLAAVSTAAVSADAGALFGNRVANELAANGPARFFAALRTNHLEYPAYYLTGDEAQLRDTLRAELGRGGGEFEPGRAEGLARRFPARPGLGAMNVVVLSEESFGAEFVGAYGDVRGLTPEFDALAREGLLFRHAYATGTRTVRGLEAISASFPPIPSESILKRPGGDHVATWGSVMKSLGYDASFLYGGYGTFDNMTAYFGGNGFTVSDRSDIANPRFANIWGVSDEDLFAHAVDWFDARAAAGLPFFSIVMSTSNHKPYTFPEGVPGVAPSGGGREAGIRYADHAIGEFFRAARTRPWFAHTVFVVVADHGARVYGAAEIPLYSYEIPLLVIAPGVPPGTVDTPTSQIDIAPTVLGMLGLPYDAPFFGQDVLHWAGGPRTLLFNHNHSVAAFRDGHLAVLDLHRRASCQRYERAPGSARRGADRFDPEECDADLLRVATAYYQTGYQLFTRGEYR